MQIDLKFLGVMFIVVFVLLLLVVLCVNLIRQILYNQKLSRSGIADIDSMDGLTFEKYLETYLSGLGYKVLKTKASGDFGADLVIQLKNKKVVVQAKRYAVKNKVGLKAVQEVFTAQTFYDADVCCVVTTSFYTQQAKTLATKCNVKLVDRDDLINLIAKNTFIDM